MSLVDYASTEEDVPEIKEENRELDKEEAPIPDPAPPPPWAVARQRKPVCSSHQLQETVSHPTEGPLENLPDDFLPFDSPSVPTLSSSSDHAPRVAAAQASRKRHSNAPSASAPRNKLPRGTLLSGSGEGASPMRGGLGKQHIVSHAPLLYRQDSHKSQIAGEDTVKKPTMRQCKVRTGQMWKTDVLTNSYIERAGFKYAGKTSTIELDPGLLHALAERWRPETHTFHLPQGEMTITLQDVSMILGLRVDGPPITDFYRQEILPETNVNDVTKSTFTDLFGVTPGREHFKKSTLEIKVKYLKNWKVEDNESGYQTNVHLVAQCRARAYIMILLGECLLANSSAGYVPLEYIYFLRDFSLCSQYSWASAVLSCTYRGLCRWVSHKDQTDLPVCGVLLQVWCWTRIGVGRPKVLNSYTERESVGCWWVGAKSRKQNVIPGCHLYYRDQLISLKKNGITWMPYSDNLQRLVPEICMQAWDLSKIRIPLIHFNCVEWQMADRVYRQLGLPQPIPDDCPWDRQEWDHLHGIDKWMKSSKNIWEMHHQRYILAWERRWVDYAAPVPRSASYKEYMSWYASATNNLVYYDDFPLENEEVEEDTPVIPTQGYFEQYGKSHQVLMKQFECILKTNRKMLLETDDLYIKKCANSNIQNVRVAFEEVGQLRHFDSLMSQELIQSSDEEDQEIDEEPRGMSTQPPVVT